MINLTSNSNFLQHTSALTAVHPASSFESKSLGVLGSDNSASHEKSLGVLVAGSASVDKASIGKSSDKVSTYDALRDIAKKQKSEDKNLEEQEKADKEKIQTLKERDQEVRIHEQAHAAVGGQYAGAPSYEFETGPDGKRYAVGGEVSIDVSEEKDPEDTISKMQIVRAAALAPAEPSAQDYKVAADASQKEQSARAHVAKQSMSPQQGQDSLRPLISSTAGQALQLYQTTAGPVSAAFTAHA